MFNRDTAIRSINLWTTINCRFSRIAIAAAILTCLLIDTAAAAQDQTESSYMASALPPLDARNLHHHDKNGLNFTAGNPFLHRLSSGLKFRGLKLSDNFYLTPKKQGKDINNALGISYADDDILYYFSPQLLSVSFRY